MRAANLFMQRGFSVSEVLGVLTILGAVAATFLPHITTPKEAADQAAHERHKAAINVAVERFYINESRWPADDLSDIGSDRNYFPDGLPHNPIDGRPYYLDPTTHRVE